MNDVSFYKHRFEVLFLANFIVLLYSVSLITLLFSSNIITVEHSSIHPSIFKPVAAIVDNLSVVLIIIFSLLAVLTFYGSRTEPTLIAGFIIKATTPTTSLIFLIACANLFIIELFLPNILLGGSLQSCFGSMLVTMCSLTVIITRGWWIRTLFLLSCMVLYTVASIYYVKITVNNPALFTWCDNATIYMSIAIALLLSWRGEYIIFMSPSTDDES